MMRDYLIIRTAAHGHFAVLLLVRQQLIPKGVADLLVCLLQVYLPLRTSGREGSQAGSKNIQLQALALPPGPPGGQCHTPACQTCNVLPS